MKLIGFKQDVKEFLTSKTNQTAIIAIVGLIAGYYTGTVDLQLLLTGVLGSVFAMTLKDATVK